MGSPSGRVPEQAPERFLVATEACGAGTPDLSSYSMVLGYMGIYRQKKSVRGATRGPRDKGACLGGGRAFLSPSLLEASLACTPSLPDHVRSKKTRSRRFHSVWTPFDIPFLRNTEIGNKTTIWAGPPINRLVPKVI